MPRLGLYMATANCNRILMPLAPSFPGARMLPKVGHPQPIHAKPCAATSHTEKLRAHPQGDSCKGSDTLVKGLARSGLGGHEDGAGREQQFARLCFNTTLPSILLLGGVTGGHPKWCPPRAPSHVPSPTSGQTGTEGLSRPETIALG